MIPSEFISRLKEQLGDKKAGELLSNLSDKGGASIRINPLKFNKPAPSGERVPWCPEGVYLEKRPLFTLDPHFHAGTYYVQEASGMFLGEVVRQVRQGEQFLKVLDLCGAPGGKATHLSSLIGDNGLLVTNEVIRSRARILSDNITRWGMGNVMVTNNDPGDFSEISGWFDMVVVDAPCSGEGMFRSSIARREWSPANADLCSSRQRRILMNIWPALRNEGILIYSTCTFNPEENEKNLAWLSGEENFESVKLDINGEWGIQEILHKGIYGYAFYPGRIKGDGFFISVMRKTGRREEKRLLRGNLPQGPTVSDSRVASEWSSFGEERIFVLRDKIVAGPAGNNMIYPVIDKLNIIKPGTIISVRKGADYLPDNELALSVRINRDAFDAADLDYNEAIKYLRKDNIIISNRATGWMLILFEGSILGLAKNLGNRLNNYYPTEWRIRMEAKQDEQH
ncbi:MAG TPA: hypothetical protein VMW76_02765 [Bacteroidales bacterium]|nr:hypothetical protein [Bacteroidales bacterium]